MISLNILFQKEIFKIFNSFFNFNQIKHNSQFHPHEQFIPYEHCNLCLLPQQNKLISPALSHPLTIMPNPIIQYALTT